jgi:hypothetical protein
LQRSQIEDRGIGGPCFKPAFLMFPVFQNWHLPMILDILIITQNPLWFFMDRSSRIIMCVDYTILVLKKYVPFVNRSFWRFPAAICRDLPGKDLFLFYIALLNPVLKDEAFG